MSVVVDDPDMIHGNWKPERPGRWNRGYPPYSLRPLGEQLSSEGRKPAMPPPYQADPTPHEADPTPCEATDPTPYEAADPTPREAEARRSCRVEARGRSLPPTSLLILLLLLTLAAGRFSTVLAPTWAMTYANLPVPAYAQPPLSSTTPFAWEDRGKPVVRMHDELVGTGTAEAVPWTIFAMAAMSAALNRIAGVCC